jgi:capsular polysaccharide biosynthesis protein
VSSESEPIEGNNVYVSRSGAVERRVLNENEVMNVLSEYGFERYCLENQSLSENVQLFSQADLVVGPHGAGLTDIIFANDCTLLELFGEKVKQPYELLAETLGVNYEPMYCQADSADVVVDTEQLELRVSQLVENI